MTSLSERCSALWSLFGVDSSTKLVNSINRFCRTLQIVMDENQRPNGIPVTWFTVYSLLSIYAQSDDEKLAFDYNSGNTSILVSGYVYSFHVVQLKLFFLNLG